MLSHGDSRRLWLKLGIACDAADAVAGILAGRNGEVSETTKMLVTGTALFAVALEISALRSEAVVPGSP